MHKRIKSIIFYVLHAMNDYKIFTDATADIDESLLKDLPELGIIPMDILMDDVTYSYGPEGTIDHHSFYGMLTPQVDVKTTGINPEVYEEHFESSLKNGQDVIYICFTSGLSSTYNTARLIKAELKDKYPDRKIFCIDSLCASIGEAFLVYESLKKQKEGLSYDEMVEWIETNKTDVAHWFTLDSFEYLVKGGRISSTSAAIATTLQIKPLLSVNEEGKLFVAGKTRGRHSATASILKKIDSDWKKENGNTIFVGHGNCEEEALQLKEKVLLHHPDADVKLLSIGPVIGCHTGPSILALVFWE